MHDWIGPLLFIAALAVAGAAVALLVRWLHGMAQRQFEKDLIGREMGDECFAKSEMLHEDCEGQCKGLGHLRDKPDRHTSLPPDLAP